MSALRGFVLVPSIIYLIAGAVLLSIGFVSLFRIRSSIRKGKISDNFIKKTISYDTKTSFGNITGSDFEQTFLYSEGAK